MSSITDINKLIRQFLRELMGMPVDSIRPANQLTKTGAKNDQFATVLVTLIEQNGQDDIRFANQDSPSTDLNETVEGLRKISVSVQFFKGDAYTKACRLQALLGSSGAAQKLKALGLGFIRSGPVRNLTAVIDADWEERGQIDIEFYLISKQIQVMPSFGKFPISIGVNSSTSSSEVNAP